MTGNSCGTILTCLRVRDVIELDVNHMNSALHRSVTFGLYQIAMRACAFAGYIFMFPLISSCMSVILLFR